MRRFLVLWATLALAFTGMGTAGAATADEKATYDIVVVGGHHAVSPAVFAELEAMTTGNVVRVSGPDRYATAVAVSEIASDPGVPIVFVATGGDFPDALVAGPVAAERGGSVLLVEPGRVPDVTKQELLRLQPQRVVALGGRQAISQSVLEELAELTGVEVDVVSGPTRFATAAAVSSAYFSPGVPVAYVATGLGFADALTSVPAAAVDGAPILLTASTALPPSTRAELTRLRPGSIKVVGGRSMVTDQVLEELAGYTEGTVQRISGPGREATAAAISEYAFPAGAGIVFLATGADFPDALAIGAAAGAAPHNRFALQAAGPNAAGETPGPVLLTRPGSLPSETVAELIRLGRSVPAPLAKDQQVETDFQTPVAITLTATGGAAFTFDVTSAPDNGTLSGTAPNLTYTPGPGFHGTDTFEFTASIGAITSAPATVTVTVHPPDTPVADAQSVTTPFETPVAVTLTGTSPGGLPLTYTVVDSPGDGTLSGTAPNLTYTPDAGFEGADAFTFTVSDGIDTSASATVDITVLPEPPTAGDVSATVDQDDEVDITLLGSSPSSQPLTYHYAQPGNGAVAGSGPLVTYTPTPGFHGLDTFTYHVNDTFNDSNTATVTVTVEPLPPVAHDQTVVVPKDSPGTAVTLTGDSPSGGPLTYTVVDGPEDGSLSGTAPNLTYTPDAGYEGDDEFTFRVNDGFDDSNLATVTLQVRPALPVAADVSESTDQGEAVLVTLSATNNSGNTLMYHYTQPENGIVSGLGPDVTYTPHSSFHGVDTFTYYVNDEFNDSNTATVTVTVAPGVPIAHDLDVQTAFETMVTIELDGESVSGGTLLYEVVDLPESGTTNMIGSGPDVEYTPDDGFSGDDTFTYHVFDGFNFSNVATVTVTVEPQPPVAHDDSVATTQDTPLLITLGATNHSANELDYHYTPPAMGTLTGDGPDVTYEPHDGLYGIDEFTFYVFDGFNNSNTATITVTVAFAAADHDFDTFGNTQLRVGTADTGDPSVFVSASLLDGADPGFSVHSIDTAGTAGEVTLGAGGTFRYRPAAGFTGDDTFAYTITDGDVSGSGTVTITVEEMVWYVAEGQSGTGRSWAPFATLAEAEAASDDGDTIFVYQTGVTYTDGITLKPDQKLLGEQAGLTVGGVTLVDPGARPEIGAASGSAIVLAPGVEVRGLDVIAAAERGLFANGTGGTVTVTDVHVSGATGNAVELLGPGDFTLTSVNVTNTGGAAVRLDGMSGTVTHTGTITQSGTTQAVSVQNLAASGDVSLGTVSSAASGIVVAGNDGEVEIDGATLGSAGTRISGQPGLQVTGGTGDVTVTALSVHTHNAPALALDNTGTVTVVGGTADTTGSAALFADDVAAAITLGTATSAGSTGTGIDLTDTSGSVSIGGGAISSAAGNAINVSGGSVALTADVTVTNAAQHSVRVANLNGGSVTLSGAVTDTGSGISLTGNTGSTIAFGGQLAVTTTGSTAFSATGGGTVTATASTSTLDATGAPALVVTGTTLGAAGLTFRSVGASGGAHGIELDDTGSGTLSVLGDGSTDRNAQGGTINGASSHAVFLRDTGPVSLRNMTIDENDHAAVHAERVNGLTFVGVLIEDNTTSGAGTQNSLFLRNLSGTTLLQDTVINGSAHNQIDVEQTVGSATVELLRTEVHENTNNFGLFAVARNSAELTLDIDDSNFWGHHSYAVHVQSLDTSDVTVRVVDSEFDDNHVSVHLAAWGDSTMHSTVTGNTVGQHSGNVMIVVAVQNALHEAVVAGNTINAAGSSGYGIEVAAEDAAKVRAIVDDNTVTGVDNIFAGIRVLSVGSAGDAESHAVLTGNTVTTTGLASSGFDLGAFGSNHICAALSGNSATSGASGEGMWVETLGSATFQFEGLTPGPATPAEVEAFLLAQNPGLDGVDAFGSGLAGVAAGTCERPS